MMNYHELTMEEAKDSPAKKKQFLVISVIGIFCIATGLVSAGIFAPVIITEGTFPGGEFMYKSKTKDYATSMALFRESSKLFKVDGLNGMWGDFLFGVFHDDPANVPGGSTRYSVGPIFDKATKEKYQKLLLKRQSKFATWRTSKLPEVPAAISHFPWSNGFFASLIQQKIVLPKLFNHAKDKGVEYPVIVFTCSEQGEDFAKIYLLICPLNMFIESFDLKQRECALIMPRSQILRLLLSIKDLQKNTQHF